jgi:hypothetical protein
MAKTSIAQIKIVNIETGEEIIRDATSEEVAQMELDKAEAIKQTELKAKAAIDKAALLARLGLTEDELKTILG